MGIWRKMMCGIGRHKRLDLIQTFGMAQRVGCPHCGKQFAIHHGFQSSISWGAEVESMYRLFGHTDMDEKHASWQRYRADCGFTPTLSKGEG